MQKALPSVLSHKSEVTYICLPNLSITRLFFYQNWLINVCARKYLAYNHTVILFDLPLGRSHKSVGLPQVTTFMSRHVTLHVMLFVSLSLSISLSLFPLYFSLSLFLSLFLSLSFSLYFYLSISLSLYLSLSIILFLCNVEKLSYLKMHVLKMHVLKMHVLITNSAWQIKVIFQCTTNGLNLLIIQLI